MVARRTAHAASFRLTMVAIAVPPDAIQPVRMFMARRAAAAKPIYRAWRSARSKLATSMAQLDELRRASRCPKLETILPAHRVDAMVDSMQRAIVFGALPIFAQDVGANDPNDAFLLAMALAGEAGYIVTSDRSARLPQRSSIGRIPIATPAAFCADALRRHARRAFQLRPRELRAATNDGALCRHLFLNNWPLCPARRCIRSRRSLVSLVFWGAMRASTVVDTRLRFLPAMTIGPSPTAPRSFARPPATRE